MYLTKTLYPMLTVILLPFLVNCLCLLNLGINLGINPNKSVRLGKNSPNLGENTGLFGLGSSLYSAVK